MVPENQTINNDLMVARRKLKDCNPAALEKEKKPAAPAPKFEELDTVTHGFQRVQIQDDSDSDEEPVVEEVEEEAKKKRRRAGANKKKEETALNSWEQIKKEAQEKFAKELKNLRGQMPFLDASTVPADKLLERVKEVKEKMKALLEKVDTKVEDLKVLRPKKNKTGGQFDEIGRASCRERV